MTNVKPRIKKKLKKLVSTSMEENHVCSPLRTQGSKVSELKEVRVLPAFMLLVEMSVI